MFKGSGVEVFCSVTMYWGRNTLTCGLYIMVREGFIKEIKEIKQNLLRVYFKNKKQSFPAHFSTITQQKSPPQ